MLFSNFLDGQGAVDLVERFERIDARRAIVSVDVARGSAAAEGDATDPRWLRALIPS